MKKTKTVDLNNTTVVAIATPPGNSGVGVVRISGDKAKEILQIVIKEKFNFEPRKMYLKKIYINDVVDEALVVYFCAPYSFTGEDVVEIQFHGSYLLSQKIIEYCIDCGAILAQRGEFSKRAFINGKLSIDKAEGIMDLISAESEAQLSAGSSLVIGKLTQKIINFQDVLTEILAEIEAKLDYPEYEFSLNESSDIKLKLKNMVEEIENMINDSQTGMLIKNGVKVAIVGSPNVGKSSLLNALSKSDKAIVTEIAGTTRDVIEAEYLYKGIIFRLYDTAGVHESNDVVEKIGIKKAKDVIKEADLVLKISDEENICQIETKKPFIEIFNKIDKISTKNLKNIEKTTKKNYFFVSAKDKTNLEELKEEIFKRTINHEINPNKFYLTNIRHVECLKIVKDKLLSVISIFDKISMDVVSSEIKSAWSKLGEISGTTSDEKIIDKIFSKFCLGK